MEIGWLLFGAFIVVAIAFIRWDNGYMRRQAEREARDVARGVRTTPFPDFEEWKEWDKSI